MRRNIHCLLILWVLGLVSACDNGGDATSNSGKLPAAESDPLKSFISETEPENAVPLQTVIDAKTFGSEITVIGKVGDMQNHLAAFRLVDLQYQDCNRPDDPCNQPWDYC
jgi:hypothetical protein